MLFPCARLAAAEQSHNGREAEAGAAAADASIRALEEAARRDPDNAALQYNLGTRRYEGGDYNAAVSALSQALGFSRGWLRHRAAYNLGNARYRQGQAAGASEQAAGLYRQALEHYREALERDPSDQDARFNYELVERRLTELQAQQAEQQQHQHAGGQREQSEQAQQADRSEGDAQQQPMPARPYEESESPSSESAQTDSAQAQSGEETQDATAPSGEQGQEQQARAGEQAQPRAGEDGSGDQRQTASRRQAGQDEKTGQPRDLSRQEALWILDAVKREEQAAMLKRHGQPGVEAPVEKDW